MSKAHSTPRVPWLNRTVLNGVNASAPGGGDIVLLRPGSYNEQITLNRPVTLRATRAGWVTIGKP